MAKTQKYPSLSKINWRALDLEECRRLYNIGSSGGKTKALYSIIKKRKEVMEKDKFNQWFRELSNEI